MEPFCTRRGTCASRVEAPAITTPTDGKVFDLTLPLDQVAEGDRAMDERRAIKTLLRIQ